MMTDRRTTRFDAAHDPWRRRWGLLVVLTLACVVGCRSVDLSPRGTTIPTAELRAERDDLEGVVERRLAAGDNAGAFYALEVYKTRSFLATRLARDFSADDQPERLEPTFVVAEGEGDRRGVKLDQLGNDSMSSLSTLDQRAEKAFWRYQAVVERRLSLVNPYYLPSNVALTGAVVMQTQEEVERTVNPGELFVSFFVSEDRVRAWFVSVDGPVMLDLGPRAPIEAAAQALVIAARDPRSGDAWQAPAAELYQLLLAPYRETLNGVSDIYVASHGFLGNVPLALLRDAGGRLLVEQSRITAVPSATLHRHLKSRPLFSRPPRALVAGNATYPAPWSALPEAEEEARTVAEIFDDSLLLVGGAATETRVRDSAQLFNILHFATHGMLGGGATGLASSLILTPTEQSDGYLTALEIARLDLSHTYLVILSACETSVSFARGDAASLASLTNAFLAAGAPTVIGSLWQVPDAATAKLMLDFYQRFPESGASAALTSAQNALREDPRYAHPFHWAAFGVYGWDR